MRFGAGLGYVGKYNENAVIHALRRIGPASQAEIAEASGLAVQTVSTILKNLSARGYLSEVRAESQGRGRPRVILDLVASARYSIGVHIDPTVMSAVVLDLRGQVVHSATSEEVHSHDPERSVDVAARMIEGLIERTGRENLVGVCLALPGPLDERTESVVNSVWLPGWTNFRPGRALEQRIGLPVPVVKDTLAAVIGENWVRADESTGASMVFVYVGTGTGVGISLEGEPLRGASGNAGEVGQMLLALGELSGTRRSGLDNDPVIMVEKAHEQGVLDGPPPARADLALVERQFRSLCELARGGERTAEEILQGAAQRIAQMTVMTAELVDADVVVFGGPYWEAVEPWYRPATLELLEQPSARGPHDVDVLSTSMGPNVGAVGAAAVVLDARYVPRAPGRLPGW